MLIFYIRRRICVNFLKYSIDFLVQTLFSSLLVENDRNLFVAEMFRIQLSLKKSPPRLTFQSVVYNIYIFFILY